MHPSVPSLDCITGSTYHNPSGTFYDDGTSYDALMGHTPDRVDELAFPMWDLPNGDSGYFGPSPYTAGELYEASIGSQFPYPGTNDSGPAPSPSSLTTPFSVDKPNGHIGNSFHSVTTHPVPHGYIPTSSTQTSAYGSFIPHQAIAPSPFKNTGSIATALCVTPLLVQPPMHPEYDLAPAIDEHSSRAVSHCARRTRSSSRADHTAVSYTSKPSPSPEPYPQTSSQLIASRRRNVPASALAAIPPSSFYPTNPWQCPYCEYVQRNRRTPDLKRHIQTHTRGAAVAAWVCCGVPIEDALEAGVPAEVVRAAPIFDFEGVLMIGGCRKTFSRRDALTRHLRNEKGRCFGDSNAAYQPGNRLED
ncbi:hypothetical protein BD309DRAFT_1084345 [Dichomitus squalens]|uniref:Uncharacterized protein n=1 Tax=Dichomitus squalens TaxID=114155 RepID=A0A4Q9NEN6_9APHY|nr:hypothetical protein BD309DRAFT_1084345 [Dichomitus squalens]TBU60737.1 hypothetical protein BD310DRAFT_921969 [Dichomitus squalens]